MFLHHLSGRRVVLVHHHKGSQQVDLATELPCGLYVKTGKKKKKTCPRLADSWFEEALSFSKLLTGGHILFCVGITEEGSCI